MVFIVRFGYLEHSFCVSDLFSLTEERWGDECADGHISHSCQGNPFGIVCIWRTLRQDDDWRNGHKLYWLYRDLYPVPIRIEHNALIVPIAGLTWTIQDAVTIISQSSGQAVYLFL